MFSADGHLLEDSSGLFQTQVNDFMITDQTSFQIFYKESKTWAQVLVNSREGEEREEGEMEEGWKEGGEGGIV